VYSFNQEVNPSPISFCGQWAVSAKILNGKIKWFAFAQIKNKSPAVTKKTL